MILQSVIFPEPVCWEPELYFHSRGDVLTREDSVLLDREAVVRSDSYMNLFDAGCWRRYTGITQYTLQAKVSGKGIVQLWRWCKKTKQVLLSKKVDAKQVCCLEFPFVCMEEGERYFLELRAEGEMCLSGGSYMAGAVPAWFDVHIGLILCTYQRNRELYRILERIRCSRFFREGEEQGRLHVCVVDNASELPKIKEKNIQLFHNPNTGGSGGFARGIQELCRMEAGISHVVFMDDDAELILETLYRLYALLSLLLPDYREEVVAGRMFRTDRRWIQYTAAEIWNGGEICHVGENLDMTRTEYLYEINQAAGEYSGWWFACFPMSFTREQQPLPFFLHCDDVEYGLRHGGAPIVLNGIQVWHDTWEQRQTPVIAYYDMRNRLIVNALYGIRQKEILSDWKKTISQAHADRDYQLEYMLICAFRDYQKGLDWLFSVNAEKHHRKLKKIKGCRWKNMLAWRVELVKYLIKNRRRTEKDGN